MASPADEARLKFLIGQLHALALAISQAVARNDQSDLINLRTNYSRLKTEADALILKMKQQEGPGAVEKAALAVQDVAASVAKSTGEFAGETLKGGINLLASGLKTILLPVAIVGAIALLLYAAVVRGRLTK